MDDHEDLREAYEDLANAIIISAVRDYEAALLSQLRHPESRTAKDQVKRLEKFFHSEWYLLLTNLDASCLLRMVRKKVKEEWDAHQLELS